MVMMMMGTEMTVDQKHITPNSGLYASAVDPLSLFRCHTNFLLLPIDLCHSVAILFQEI